uniref:CBM21 domain-containing protein n=1 Tax=Echeneis naucrates TaxID=173247 RepID=A0A665UCS3_ECHNA
MEFVGPPRLFEAWDLLGVPGLGSMDVDDDEGEMIIGIRPKCSPLPRRKSSVTDEDSEPELPLSGSRRVSFADAKGLSLVQVKEFDTWDVPTLRGYESSDSEGKEAEEYFLSLHSFSLPLSPEELCIKVQDQKVELESINLLPGTTILKGVIRVLNISFSKAVYIRTTLDAWSSHFDLLAEYIPGSSDGVMDCFSFKLTLVPPFGEQGARVDFSLRYETPVGTFWANNNNKNYVMFCRQRSKGKPQKDNIKKSCLKSVSKGQEVMTSPEASGRKISDEVNQLSSDSGENDKMEDNSGEIIKTKSTATASSEADNSLEALQDLELTEINHSATKETTGCFHSISHCEIIGRNDYTTPEASLENQECRNVKEQTKLTNNSYECETKHSAESVGGGEAAESLIKEVMGNNRTPDDMFAELKDEYTSEDEPIIVSGEVETALLNEEEISSADNTEVKNWEMMVEEEEENMLTGQGEGKTISLKGELLTAAGENRTKPEGVAGVEDKEKGREEESQGIVVGKYGGNVEEEFKNETAAEEDAAEKMEAEEKREEKGQTDKEKHFAEIQEVSIKRTNVQEEEMNGEEETEIDSNQGDEACMVWRDQEKPPRVNTEEENPNCKKEVLVEARDSEMVTADPERMTREDREDDTAQNHAEDLLSAPVSTEEKSATDKQRKGGIVPLSPEMHLYKEEDLQKSLTASHYRPRAENESCAVHILTDEPESAQTSHDMAESDSDEEEVELYMHCLRAVHAGSQASKDRDMGFSVGKRPSVSRSKLLSTPMPSISESLDEEQQLSCQHPDVDTTYLQPTAAALPLSSGQERIRRNVSQWRKTFSCSNILKILLYTTLLVIFLVVAYHYDFLVCFVVYLISLFWLCFQGEQKQKTKVTFSVLILFKVDL